MKKSILCFILLLLLVSKIFAQNIDSLNFSAGPDLISQCSNGVCLFADFKYLSNNSNHYNITSIPFDYHVDFEEGNSISLNDDNFSQIIDLPFKFYFFGNLYDKIVIGSNGLISFNTDYANSTCIPALYDCPNVNLPNNAIYGALQDLNPTIGGKISYNLYGVEPNRKFVINFNEIPLYNCQEHTVTQQIILHENNSVIDVFIKNKPNCYFDTKAIIGIQDSLGLIGFVPNDRNAFPIWSATEEAWRFLNSKPDDSISYQWYNENILISESNFLYVFPLITSEYIAKCTFIDQLNDAYIFIDTVMVYVESIFQPIVYPEYAEICPGESIQIYASGGINYVWDNNIGETSTITVSPQYTTTYNVSITNESGCSGSYSTLVFVNTIDLNIKYFQGKLISKQSDAIYQWVDCNNNFEHILYETNSTFTPETNGSYAVIINYHNCIDTSACFTVNDVGIYSENADTDILIYPNPNTGTFTLITNKDEFLTWFKISIANDIGQVIYETISSDKISTISQNLTPGMYLIQVQVADKKYRTKLFVSP